MDDFVVLLKKYDLPYISREWLFPGTIVYSEQLNSNVKIIDIYKNDKLYNSPWYVDCLYRNHVYTFVYEDYKWFKTKKDYQIFLEEEKEVL